MTPFRYRGPARITHLNTRKEGPDDEKHLAIDLKLSIAVHADVITQHIDDQARDFLWTDIGAMRNLSLGPLQYGYQLENYTLGCLGSHFGGVKVKRFQVEPKDGLFAEVVFSVSFDPTGNEVARLAESLQDEFPISLRPSQEDLPGLSDTGRVATRVIAEIASARRGILKPVEASGGTVIFGSSGDGTFEITQKESAA